MNGALNRAILVLSGVLLLLILAVIAVSMNRGFDFQDESFYMLCYDHTDVYKEGISSYHVIAHRLVGWMNGGIVSYRFTSLVLTLLSSYALFRGLHRWLTAYMPGEQYFSAPFLFIYVFIANFIHYCTGVQTVNYNFIINTTVISCTGILLGLLVYGASDIVKHRSKLLGVLLVGILCAFSFFTKFSAGVLQVLAYSALFFIYYIRHSFKSRLIIITTLLTGCIVGALIYFLFFESYASWSHNFMVSYREMTKPTDHPPGALLQSYLTDIGKFVTFFRVNLYWLIALPLLLLVNKRFGSNSMFARSRNIFIALCLGYFIYRLYLQQFHRSNFIREWGHRTGYFYPIIMLLLLSLMAVAAFNNKVSIIRFARDRYHIVITALFLLFTPLLAVIGTSNSLFLNTLFNAAPWLCLILMLLAYMARYTSYTISGSVLVLTLLFTTGQIIDGNTYAPYYATYRKSKTNLFDQTERAEQIPQLRGVYIDTATKRFLHSMHALLQERNMPASYPVWSFSSGVAYLMGGVQIEEFWYNKTCEATRLFGVPQKAPIFITADGMKKPNADLLACLRTMGINYPEDYEPVGDVWFPHFQTTAHVLFPKSYRP